MHILLQIYNVHFVGHRLLHLPEINYFALVTYITIYCTIIIWSEITIYLWGYILYHTNDLAIKYNIKDLSDWILSGLNKIAVCIFKNNIKMFIFVNTNWIIWD